LTTADAGTSGEKSVPVSIQYDDKFYDLDDGWICDEEVGANDDGVADFIPESES